MLAILTTILSVAAATEAAALEPVGVEHQALQARLERNHRVGHVGLGLGVGGVALTAGGLALVFGGQSEATFVGGAGVAGLGGLALIAGGGMAAGGSLSATYNRRALGLDADPTAGWIGAGLMGASVVAFWAESGVAVAGTGFALGLAATGVQLHLNARARSVDLALSPWADPVQRRVGLVGRF